MDQAARRGPLENRIRGKAGHVTPPGGNGATATWEFLILFTLTL